jgi:hypothetical protein
MMIKIIMKRTKKKPRIDLTQHSVISALECKDTHEITPEDMVEIALFAIEAFIDFFEGCGKP